MTSFMVPAAGGTAAVLAGVLVAGSGSGLTSDLALTIAGCVGSGLTCVLMIFPLFTFVKPIIHQQGVGDRTAYGHSLMMMSGAAWGMYAVITWKESRITALINAACFLFQMAYVLVFIRYAYGKTRWITVGLLLTALLVSGALTWCVVEKVMRRGEWDRRTIAAVASVISGISYAAVGLDIAAVANSKDVANMDPLAEVLFNLLGAATWVYYAYAPTTVDNYIGVPNAIGVGLLLLQLVVYLIHCNAKPEDEEEEEDDDEVAGTHNECDEEEAARTDNKRDELPAALEGETSQQTVIKAKETVPPEKTATSEGEASQQTLIKAKEVVTPEKTVAPETSQTMIKKDMVALEKTAAPEGEASQQTVIKVKEVVTPEKTAAPEGEASQQTAIKAKEAAKPEGEASQQTAIKAKETAEPEGEASQQTMIKVEEVVTPEKTAAPEGEASQQTAIKTGTREETNNTSTSSPGPRADPDAPSGSESESKIEIVIV